MTRGRVLLNRWTTGSSIALIGNRGRWLRSARQRNQSLLSQILTGELITETPRGIGLWPAQIERKETIMPNGTPAADTRGIVPDAEREHLKAGVGERLAWLRSRAQLTQEQAGKLAGMTSGALSKLERGVHRPTKDSLRDLAAVYEPVHPRIEFWKLCKLAGESLRSSHRRLSPARKPLTVTKAESYVEDARRALRSAGRALPGRAESARFIAQAMLEQAEKNLTIARAREELIQRIRKADESEGNSGDSVG